MMRFLGIGCALVGLPLFSLDLSCFKGKNVVGFLVLNIPFAYRLEWLFLKKTNGRWISGDFSISLDSIGVFVGGLGWAFFEQLLQVEKSKKDLCLDDSSETFISLNHA